MNHYGVEKKNKIKEKETHNRRHCRLDFSWNVNKPGF